MKKIGRLTATIVALAFAGSVEAHHSISMFDLSTPIWVKGTVVSYKAVNPHAMIELEARAEDGQVETWQIEGPRLGRLDRISSQKTIGIGQAILKVGDVIEVCGFPPKGTDVSSRRFIHGHVLVMPNGRMQSWGPYGKIDNCIRPGDEPRSWADFLNTDALAREFWCASRNYVKAENVASQAFKDEIDALMDKSCE